MLQKAIFSFSYWIWLSSRFWAKYFIDILMNWKVRKLLVLFNKKIKKSSPKRALLATTANDFRTVIWYSFASRKVQWAEPLRVEKLIWQWKWRLTSCSERTVLSPFGSFESSAMTTQLAMMVRMMVHSNTGQFTNHVVRRRTGLEPRKQVINWKSKTTLNSNF